VEIIVVIVNKVLGAKLDYVTEFTRRGFKRKGLELLGVIPHRPMLSNPTIGLIREELDAEMLNETGGLQNLVEDVTVGAMGAHNALSFFKAGMLLITPGDREDIILAACTSLDGANGEMMAGIVLTGGLRPSSNVMKVIRAMPIPVMLAAQDSYLVASKVHDLTVKTRPEDAHKITMIRDLIASSVDVKKILKSL
jgi:BioD-like phosphotransacetylase family protein